MSEKITLKRCTWVTNDPIYQDYHDHEWGVRTTDPKKLFEALCLETQQAGLSWLTVLQKREAYRTICHIHSPEILATVDAEELASWMNNSALIRHKAKLEALVTNAKAFMTMENQGQDFADFIHQFVPMEDSTNSIHGDEDAATKAAKQLCSALKSAGFKFVGPTTTYSFLEAVGLVGTHQPGCFLASTNPSVRR